MSKTKTIKNLPPAAFSNAINNSFDGYDFRNWERSPEWRIFEAGMKTAADMIGDKARSLVDDYRWDNDIPYDPWKVWGDKV